jgi:hypothetical protein
MMKNIVLFISLVCFLHINLYPQVITRRGSTEWIEKQGKILSKDHPKKYVVTNDVVETEIEKLDIKKNDFSRVIGKDIAVFLDFFKLGKVENINDSLEIRTLKIESNNAQFLSLIFSEFQIPEKGELFIYNQEKTVLVGPFTNKNNPDGGSYAIDIIEGDNLILEYHRKKHDNTAKSKIIISKIIHGLNPLLLDNAVKGPNTVEDENCLVDVNCSEGDGWDAQKRGTCFILKLGDPYNPNISGSPWASAALINNTQEDYIPYIFTANHNTGGTGSDISLWIFRFKYWRTTCEGSINSITSSYCGGEMIERWEYNDIALIKMFETPNLSDNLYYCGWNRSSTKTFHSTLISHPQGGNHLMKIAKSNNITGSANQYWRSNWYVGGATSGSSGGPLFDGNKRIIGAHHGRISSDCDADALAGSLYASWIVQEV